jgi:hypothetical protein
MNSQNPFKWRTIRGIEIMHAINKGQVEGINNRDSISPQEFVESLFEMAA